MGLIDGFEHIVRENEILAPYTWFRLGGPAQYFAEPTTAEELGALVKRCREEDVVVRLLGGGSNLLVKDEGAAGMIVHLSAPAFSDIRCEGNVLRVGGGAKLSHVISSAVREGLSGFEQLTGVPGTIGGALHHNAGTRGGEIGQFTKSATVMKRTGEIVTREGNDLRFSYRQSSLNELVILDAEFELESEDTVELTKRMQKLWILRRASQPARDQNMGCIFKNPGGLDAGDVIEQAGLKGARVGDAALNDKHGNYIIAHPGSRSEDILRLIELIRSGVSDRVGIDLELAIDLW